MRLKGADLVGGETVPWVGDAPTHFAGLIPDKVALHYPEGNRSLTYAQLAVQADRAAGILAGRGVRGGDRIIYLGRNNILHYVALFGAMKLGAVLVPVNWRSTAYELAHILTDTEAHLVITDDEFRAAAIEASRLSGTDAQFLTTEGGCETLLAQLAIAPPECGGETDSPALPHDPDRVMIQFYTSGTTGRPKGVMITHAGMNAAARRDPYEYADNEVIISAMPNFHVGGNNLVLYALANGATCVNTAASTGEQLLPMILGLGATRTFLVPVAIRSLVDIVKAGNPRPPLRQLIYGGSAIGASLLREAVEVLGCTMLNAYGMTESCAMAVTLQVDPGTVIDDEMVTSVGTPLAGVEVEVRKPGGEVCGVGEFGEICLRSEGMMSGYWRNPDATRETLVDGWLRTGDGGHIDERGLLHLGDRIKDMIISGGENIYPAEVEEALRVHPAVVEVGVVGVPDEHWGEVVHAYVQLLPGETARPGELIDFARERLAKFKCPRVVHIVPDLPRTALGKVQRAELRKNPELRSA